MRLHLDIETYSEINLKQVGSYRYAEDPSTEVLVVCYAFDKGPVHVWVPRSAPLPLELVETFKRKCLVKGGCGRLYVQSRPPSDLKTHIEDGGEVRAHNGGSFERVVLNRQAGQKIGFPKIRIGQMVCTAAKSAAHGLPRALDDVANVLGTHKKDMEGRNDMLMLSKPRMRNKKIVGRYTPESDPERFANLYSYCIDDVKAERGVDEFVPDLSPNEQRVYELDQRINDRGVKVDLKAIEDVQALITEYKNYLRDKCIEWTGLSPTQTEKFAGWVRDNGYPQLSDLQAATVIEVLKSPKCPDSIKRALRLYSTYGMKAVSKFTAMQRSVCRDGRIRGMFLFYGAGTGRWSSLIVQLQNLFRPVIKDPSIAIEAFSARDLNWIRALYEVDPMKVFASTVRGMLIPDIGKDILALDFTAIEARIIAWLAGQLDILEVFRGHGKIYEHTAAKIFRIAIEMVDADQRFIGKIAVLALGYQGGKNAFAKMAKQYGVDIDTARAEVIKEEWRRANKKIVSLWGKMEEAACLAVASPGQIFSVAEKRVMFKVERDWLYMRLPSGRRLAYYKPQLDEEGKLTYLGIDTYTRRWCRVKTYGGKLTENAVQAIARDLLVNGMFILEEKEYTLIGSVHDEAISEISDTFGSFDEAQRLICMQPKWSEGLPVKAGGFREKRYRK